MGEVTTYKKTYENTFKCEKEYLKEDFTRELNEKEGLYVRKSLIRIICFYGESGQRGIIELEYTPPQQFYKVGE